MFCSAVHQNTISVVTPIIPITVSGRLAGVEGTFWVLDSTFVEAKLRSRMLLPVGVSTGRGDVRTVSWSEIWVDLSG